MPRGRPRKNREAIQELKSPVELPYIVDPAKDKDTQRADLYPHRKRGGDIKGWEVWWEGEKQGTFDFMKQAEDHAWNLGKKHLYIHAKPRSEE